MINSERPILRIIGGNFDVIPFHPLLPTSAREAEEINRREANLVIHAANERDEKDITHMLDHRMAHCREFYDAVWALAYPYEEDPTPNPAA